MADHVLLRVGPSPVGDGILFYMCGCKCGMILCRHVRALLLGISRVRLTDMGSSTTDVKYWGFGASVNPYKTKLADPVPIAELGGAVKHSYVEDFYDVNHPITKEDLIDDFGMYVYARARACVSVLVCFSNRL